MSAQFPKEVQGFRGRSAFKKRFAARLNHFSFFLYQGQPGTGKSSLILSLCAECEEFGFKSGAYLPVYPGETIISLLTRLETKFSAKQSQLSERQGDPFSRLLDLLEEHEAILLLDDAHRLRREDLLCLVRAVRHQSGQAKILAAHRGACDFSAIDRASIHLENVGPLLPETVKEIAQEKKLPEHALKILVEDATKRGSSGHPLTLQCLLGLYDEDFFEHEFMEVRSSRSLSAFRQLLQIKLQELPDAEKQDLKGLIEVGLPLEKKEAAKFFPQLSELLNKGLVQILDEHVLVHSLITGMSKDAMDEDNITPTLPKNLAQAMEKRAAALQEPIYTIRAAEILTKSGKHNEALETLSGCWNEVRNLGFLENYLKTLASIPATPDIEPKLKLLSARVRLRQGLSGNVRQTLEELAVSKDKWTKSEALASLCIIYGQMRNDQETIRCFDALKKIIDKKSELILEPGIIAATALCRQEKFPQAEKLIEELLATIKKSKNPSKAKFGELHHLLARIYAQSGNVNDAVEHAKNAAEAYLECQDLYHAATAYGFIGDLYREAGEFDQAKLAFEQFQEHAKRWGDRDLLQIAELSSAWVSLDIGDLTHASEQIETVKREMNAVASERLKRYLAAAEALLKVGRSQHEEAATELVRVIQLWEQAGQLITADILRAYQVRSLIASGQVESAKSIVNDSLQKLKNANASPRLAIFLRESALISLREKNVKQALSQLDEAQKLFAKSGNRREEAHTLYRMAYASFEEANQEEAENRCTQALKLAKKIKHARVIALAQELKGRIDLRKGDVADAIVGIKTAATSLRKLGDELGALHATESLLRAYLVKGDLVLAIKLGPRLRGMAENLGIREIGIRSIILTGMALLRRSRLKPASRCFRELPEQAISPYTAALMWRLGEGLAAVEGDLKTVQERRQRWIESLERLPNHRREMFVEALEQLHLPPRDRCVLHTRKETVRLSQEKVAWIKPSSYQLFINAVDDLIIEEGKEIPLEDGNVKPLFEQLLLKAPKAISFDDLGEHLDIDTSAKDGLKKFKTLIKNLQKNVRKSKHIKIDVKKDKIALIPSKRWAFLYPSLLTVDELSPNQKKSIELIRQFATVPIATLEEVCGVPRATIRREMNDLVKKGLLEAVRQGRGQAFRLS
ncbi:MAG: hypothetical protein QGI45_12130 [Myxococcota bacterium]|nr:hypothetical protein [Myxococcota bacterium]